MPPLWPAVFLLAGALVWLGAAPAPLTGIRLLRTPARPVSDLLGHRPDRACFTGTVVETEHGTVEAPFSGRRAVALAYQVLEEESAGLWWLGFPFGSLTQFEPIDGGAVAEPFLLDDGTGQVRVDPGGATFRLEPDSTRQVDGGDAPPERIRRYIDSNADVDDEELTVNLGPIGWGVGDDRRYVERRLEPGDEVRATVESIGSVSASVTSVSSSQISPSSISVRRLIQRSIVDFPLPLGPIRTSTSPRSIRKLTPFSTSSSP
jgi:hypothetical protein